MSLFQVTDESVPVPKKASSYSAGWDLFAPESLVVEKDKITTVSTKVKLATSVKNKPVMFKVESKSSLSMCGIVHLAGVIDSDYEGEIKILLTKVTSGEYHIPAGSAFVQITPVTLWTTSGESESTDAPIATRGKRGFGAQSTASYGGKRMRVARVKKFSNVTDMKNALASMKIVNVKDLGRRMDYDKEKYIGRGNQCKWGNTFGESDDGLIAYRNYVQNNLMTELPTLLGYDLACHCKTHCHGQVLLDMLAQYVDDGEFIELTN